MKRFKNIQGKNKEQSRNGELGIDLLKKQFNDILSMEGKILLEQTGEKEKIIGKRCLRIKSGNYNLSFVDYLGLEEVFKSIHFHKLTLEQSKLKQE